MSSFIFSVVLPILTLVFAVIAAVYAYRGDRRKSGTKISGMASWVSSFDAEDVYMGTVTLQNLKDRAVVIYAIYLEIGHGHFLDLEDRSGDPLILKPFGVYYQQYEPVDFYASNLTRVRLDDALRNRKTRRRIVLSTDTGRYTIRNSISQWSPIRLGFKNQFTAWFRPYRSQYEGKTYGSRTRFLVNLTTTGGKLRVVPVHFRVDRYQPFAGFNLTPEVLRSKESLEQFLLERAVSGELPCSDLSVVDWESVRNGFHKQLAPDVVEVEAQSWFTYYIRGWLWTRWKDFQWRRKRHHGRAGTRAGRSLPTSGRPGANASG